MMRVLAVGARFRALSPTVQGALVATVAMMLFSVVPPSVRLLSDTMSPYQIVGIRALAGILVIGGFYMAAGSGWRLKTKRAPAHFLRATANVAGMVLWFWALEYVELAKGIAIHFTMPLFITLLAVLFLGERVGPRRVIALLIGFAGALVILRPGMIEIGNPELAILASAVLYAGATVFIKEMIRTETPAAVTFYTNLFMGLWCLVPTVICWAPVTMDDALPILGLATAGLLAPLLLATAMKFADASLIGAFDFLRLPFTAAFGFALFGEIPDEFVWAGAAVIFASTYYITVREARRARAAHSAPPK